MRTILRTSPLSKYGRLGCLRRFQESHPHAKYRMIMFPCAGAGASFFRSVSLALPKTIDTWIVQLAGREDRLKEPRITSMPQLVVEIIESIMKLTDKPLIFFGHSMGSLLAYEVACALSAKNSIFKLIVSGHGAPSTAPSGHRCHHSANDMDLVADVVRLGGMPKTLLASSELLKLFLPTLKADYTILDDYQPTLDKPLSCDIHAYAGELDPEVSKMSLYAWESHSNETFYYHWFKGDHFYFNTNVHDLVNVIKKTV